MTRLTRAFFKKTGAQGGKSRARRMSAKERSESARRAVEARWAKTKGTKTRKSGPSKTRKDRS